MPEGLQSVIDRIKEMEPELMVAEIGQYCKDHPEAHDKLGEGVENLGHSRGACNAFGASYANLTTLDTLRFRYYKMLLMKEDAKSASSRQ